MDQEHRSRTLSVPEWFPDWHLIRPVDVLPLAELADRQDVAAGLLSMHPSGYVREAAVRVLGSTESERALPFLLVRSADWVEPVRLLAQDAVRACLPRTRSDDLLVAAPLVQQMAHEHGRSSHFASEVLDGIRTSLDTSTLLRGLTNAAYRVRRFSARTLVERGEASTEALAIALRQDDQVTARLVGTAAVDQAADAVSTLDVLWVSSIGSLRALALVRYQSIRSPQALVASEQGLLDPSPSVRFLAQRFLTTEGTDVPRKYREALPTRVVALQGLAEVGGPRDAEALKAYLTDPRPGARAVAVGAVGRFLGAEARSLVLERLDDESPAVIKSAGRVLARQQLDPAALESLWGRAVDSHSKAVRDVAFGVFMQQSRWPKFILACRAVAHDDADVQRRGSMLLRSAQDSWNNSFTKPSAAQVAELERLEPLVGRVSTEIQREIVDLLKHAR